ncbi:thiamine-phosphate kinase [Citricoccus nitrophenolicus]|uniref:thiamine-phosphate kinase n=1 Tax=Citricoccus nitrophenolicus TaxID=863575 RepID=UPI0031E771A9
MVPDGTMSTGGGPLTVGGLGEAGILRILNRRFAAVPASQDWPEGTVGPGDDAAVVAAPDGRFVITTDAMAQDRDFRMTWPAASSPGATAAARAGGSFAGGYATGWKAAAQNLSDINAMGAEPSGLLLALTMPSSTSLAWIEGLAAGLAAAVIHLGASRCRVVGGDLGSDDRITLAVTATGDLQGRAPSRRTLSVGRQDLPEGSDPGLDLILSGQAGWAAAGLDVLDTGRDELLRRLEAAEEAGLPGVRRAAALAASAQLRPRPPLGAGQRAAESGALAMMDVSDGLLKDTGRLAAANRLHAELDPEWVQAEARALRPLAQALDRDAEHWVRAGGEDYGLLAVLPAGGSAGSRLPAGFRRIGRLVSRAAAETAGGEEQSGAETNGGPDGWDHFSAPFRSRPQIR